MVKVCDGSSQEAKYASLKYKRRASRDFENKK